MWILGEKPLKNRLTFDIYISIYCESLFLTLNTMAQNENKTVQPLWANEGIKKTLLEMTDGIFQDYLSSLAKEKGQYEEIWKILVALTREEDKRDRYQERLFALQELKEKNEKQREEEHWRKSNLQKYLQQEIGKIDKSRLKLEEDYMNSCVNFSQQYRKIHKIIQTIDLKIDQLEAKRASLLDQWDRAHQDDSKILASELSDIEQDILSYRYDQDQFRSKLEDFEYNLNMIEWLIKEKEDEMLMLQSNSDQLWELDYFLMLQQIQSKIDACRWALWLTNETIDQLEEQLRGYATKDILRVITLDRESKLIKAELRGKNLEKRIELISLMENLVTFCPKDFFAMKDEYLSSL